MAYLGNSPRTKLWNVDTPEEVDAKIVTAVAALVDSSPSTLNTLNELAASLGDDANFATSVSTSLGIKVDKTTTVNGHALSGNVIVTKSDVSLGNVDNTSDASKPVSTAQATAIGLKADSSTVSSHTSNTSNPHSVTKAQVGLGSVDNTADSAKPVSTAQQTALNLKANIASPTFTGTVGGITKDMVGLSNVDNTTDALKPVSTATQTALNLKANLASPTFTGTVSGITKAMVGLGNVDNTSDASKPISTATQAALNLKANQATTYTKTEVDNYSQLLYDAVYVTNSTGWVDIPSFSLTHTPIANRIIISYKVVCGMGGASTGYIRLLKDNNPVYVGRTESGYQNSSSSGNFYGGSGDANNNEESSGRFILPATAGAATTIKIQWIAAQGANMYINTLGSNISGQTYSSRAISSLLIEG